LSNIYQDVLQRPSDPIFTAAEFSAAEQALEHGMTTLQFAAAVFNSAEYRTNVVNSYYLSYLGRAADPGSLAALASLLQAGLSDEVVVAVVLGSQEAFARA
jgi:hypothetical protein